ncbi:MAG TPA: RNA polymerase sigma factor [Kofleriaceae bacterium]|nr:RNA polymerase sigma factor [Kofleriaceae bacterium]
MDPGRPASDRERELVDRANGGDRRALEALYAEHRDWVTALAYRFTGSADDALDVLQETYLYFFSKFPGFELRASVRGFLYPVVKHSSITVVRRRRQLVDLESRRSGEAVTDLGWHGAEGRFARLIGRLPDGQREVVQLRFALDFRLEEIAEALEIPLGTVKSRLHNALRSLREIEAPEDAAAADGRGGKP